MLAKDKEARTIEGKDYVLEYPLHGDFALIKAHRADRWGNLSYRKAARNFNPLIAMAADFVVAEVSEIVEAGKIDPDLVMTPGVVVDALILSGGK